MAQTIERLVVDCSVIVKWIFTAEDHANKAEELFVEWQQGLVEICAPNLIQAEVLSAFLRAYRRGRVSEGEVREAVRDLLALPFVLFDIGPLAIRAFEIARQYNQRSYDCIYVALADQEGLELWTGDERLYNAIHLDFPVVRRIANYQPRKRPR